MNIKTIISLRPIFSLACLSVCLAASCPAAYAQAGGEITPKGIVYPRYTDANRPAGPLTIGTTIYNTGQNTHQYWNGSSWTNVSTPGSGGGPWSAVGNTVYNNTGTQVGVNAPDPTAALEVRGGSFIISEPYTVTTSPATNTYTIPYNGTIPIITDRAARILDPGGNGNIISNTDYAGYVRIQTNGSLRFTFESLSIGLHYLIFSTSSDPSDLSAKILRLSESGGSLLHYLNKPFIIGQRDIYIHFIISGDGAPVSGFQLLYQTLEGINTDQPYTEPFIGGLAYNPTIKSFATGLSRASGAFSTAMGYGGNTKGYGLSFSIGGTQSSGRAGNDKQAQMKMHFEEIRLLTGINGDFTITPTQITTNNSLSVFGNNTVNLNGYGF